MAVTAQEYLLAQRYHDQVVVTLPEEIDVTNSSRLQETLLAVIGRQSAVVVADLTATTFCDCSGVTAIVIAYQQAVAVGTDMRLVIRHLTARRIFELRGIDRIISIYPDLPMALSGGAETVAGEGGRGSMPGPAPASGLHSRYA